MFTLAHISDLHLGPLPKAEAWHDLSRQARDRLPLLAAQRRRKIHDPLVVAALAARYQQLMRPITSR